MVLVETLISKKLETGNYIYIWKASFETYDMD
jgi:hypothetical protein